MIKYLKNGIGKSAYGGIIPIGLMGHKEKAAWKNPYLFQNYLVELQHVDLDLRFFLLNQF